MTSSPEAHAPHGVALTGFTSFEQQALESYIKLARARSPAYVLATDLDQAHFIVANGDRAGIIDLLITSRRMGDTVLVGSHARQGTAAWLERPIDPLHLFRALDAAVRRRQLAQHASRLSQRAYKPGEIGETWPVDEALATTGRLRAIPAGDALAQRSDVAGMGTYYGVERRLNRDPAARGLGIERSLAPRASHGAMFVERRRNLAPRPTRVPPSHGEPLLALVVDADDASAVETAMALQSHGISSERASDSRRSFTLLEEQVFDAIVVDVDLGSRSDFDGLTLTKAMKHQRRPVGDVCPPIIVTSSRPSTLEQAQAMLAGADHYLAKPVGVASLAAALEILRLRPPARGADGEVPLPRIA